MGNKVLYLAFCISIIGLLILTYVSEVLNPPVSMIGDINTNSLGRNLHVRGNVSRTHEFKGGSIILTVKDSTGEIDVYLDYYTAKSMPGILEAKEVDVIGEVDEYKGRLEIKPKESNWIRVIS